MNKDNEEEIITETPKKKCCGGKKKAEGKKCCGKKKAEGKKCCGKKKAEEKKAQCECGDDCKCKENGDVCFCSLTSEIFTQLQDTENLETLMKDYFFTEMLNRGIDENLANTLANKLVVNIESFEADLYLEEEDDFEGDDDEEVEVSDDQDEQ